MGHRVGLMWAFLFVLLGFAGNANATHFRSGNLSWRRATPGSSTVVFQFESAWRRDYPWTQGPVNSPGGIVGGSGTMGTLTLGDGTTADISGTVVSVFPPHDALSFVDT